MSMYSSDMIFGTVSAQLKTLQRAFKNDKENQAYAVDLLFAYMEDKDDPGYQNWRLLIRGVLKSLTRTDVLSG